MSVKLVKMQYSYQAIIVPDGKQNSLNTFFLYTEYSEYSLKTALSLQCILYFKHIRLDSSWCFGFHNIPGFPHPIISRRTLQQPVVFLFGLFEASFFLSVPPLKVQIVYHASHRRHCLLTMRSHGAKQSLRASSAQADHCQGAVVAVYLLAKEINSR